MTMNSKNGVEKGLATEPSRASSPTPQLGLFERLPAWTHPYVQLSRMHIGGNPIIYLIHAIGAIHAGIVLRLPLETVSAICLYMVPSSTLLAWANRAWNDICDVELDAKVPRSQNRPLVRGLISRPQAFAFNLVLVAILAAFLIPLPVTCTIYAIPITIAATIYPLSKRFSRYPQVVLAIVISSGVFMGAAAAGQAPFPYPSSFSPDRALDLSTWIPSDATGIYSLVVTYLTFGVWTLVFELVYSFQDASWDEAAGVGTMTSLFSSPASAKVTLSGLAAMQVLLYGYVGTLLQANTIIWTAATMLVACSLWVKLRAVDLSAEQSCMYWFKTGSACTAWAMLSGYLGEYLRLVLLA